MKKVFMALCAFLFVASALYASQDATLTQREVRDPRKLETWLETNAADVNTRVPQSDTNATTTVTAYTPTAIGQILVGGAGVGTSAVWIAKGTTTNDWVQIEP